MKKTTTIKRILSNIQLSSMSAKEKMMWTILLPTLGDIELEKLDQSLQKEINATMDLYLESLSDHA